MSRLVPEWLVCQAASRPDLPAVSGRSAEWTYGQLELVTRRLAGALNAFGAGPGSRIATLLADDAPAVALIHSARRLGAVTVPLNRRATASELGYQLAVSAADLVVHDTAQADLARSAAGPSGSAVTVAIETLMDDTVDTHVQDELRDQVDLDAVAMIMFTSGTTAHPKAALLTHGNHIASADAWASVLEPGSADRWLACLPLFHVAGLAVVMRASRWGVALEIHDRFDVVAVDGSFEAGISHLSLVPAQLEQLLNVRAGRAAPGTLRAVLLGGGPIPNALLDRARAASWPVITTYGMTETASGIAAGGPHTGASDATAMLPLPGAELRVDPDGGAIHVRGAMVFRGYLDSDAADDGPAADGWFASGDVGRFDSDGRLHVADRRDDLIISGGENIQPAEVEAVLRDHPDVDEAAVVGRPDATWQMVPVAAIVVRRGARISDATLAAHCRERLAGYKVPVEFHRVASLPRTASGKIIRRDVPGRLLKEDK